MMNEKQLYEFVERWNDYAEKRADAGLIIVPELISDMLDEIIKMHDAPRQWVEASATSRDGVEYWARVESSGDWIERTMAEVEAKRRANQIAAAR